MQQPMKSVDWKSVSLEKVSRAVCWLWLPTRTAVHQILTTAKNVRRPSEPEGRLSYSSEAKSKAARKRVECDLRPVPQDTEQLNRSSN